jgi:predicted metal-dependent phosphoesterase TrpH
MGFSDLHIHTIHSWDGTATLSAILKYAAEKTKLNVIAITDHDEIIGALRAEKIAHNYGIEVVTGSEVSTADGHLLALYIREKIPAGMSLVDTVRYVGKLGGICIAAHPMAAGAHSLSADVIIKALRDPEIAKILVGIEAINGGLFHQSSNFLATLLAELLPVASVANSDSHILQTIGYGMTEFEGHTAQDLRLALETHQTKAICTAHATPWLVIPSWLKFYLLRKAGWVRWNPHPLQPMRLGRVNVVI